MITRVVSALVTHVMLANVAQKTINVFHHTPKGFEIRSTILASVDPNDNSKDCSIVPSMLNPFTNCDEDGCSSFLKAAEVTCLEYFLQYYNLPSYFHITREITYELKSLDEDGNCFYRGLSYVFQGEFDSYFDYRRRTARFMNKHWKVIDNVFGIRASENVFSYEYLTRQDISPAAATLAEIYAAAQIYNVVIMIYMQDKTFDYIIRLHAVCFPTRKENLKGISFLYNGDGSSSYTLLQPIQ